MSSSVPPLSIEQQLEARLTRLRANLPALPENPHPRAVLLREGWLTTQWLGALLAAQGRLKGPHGHERDIAPLADALRNALKFEQALEQSPHLGRDANADRLRVAQELCLVRAGLVHHSFLFVPRAMGRDLLERAADAFGEDEPWEVSTPAIEPPMTPVERRQLAQAFALVGGLFAGVLAGLFSWRAGAPPWLGLAAGTGLAAGVGLVFNLLVPAAKQASPETAVSGR